MSSTTPGYARTHALIRSIKTRLLALEQRPGGALPVVDADPPEGSRIRAWIMTDGRLRWRDQTGTVHQASEATPGGSTSSPSLPDMDSTVATHQVTYTAQWVASYGPGSPAAGAYGDGTRCMIGFGEEPAADLSGAVSVTAVEVWLYELDTQAAEVPLGIGTHTAASAPGAYAGSAPISRVDLPQLGSPGWVRIARDVAWRMAEEGVRGLVIDQSATGGVAGRIAAAAPRTPQLRVTYRA